ncbi:MAG: antirestriction protein ArdA [Drouetiella hepatica Uher 2000/2452]|jgi:antirestriction protein|uniref:Antirestriction protein ArdA n=1 Tax=Drouetiella hepatica Uher 2000/2452 TaxID=904376 RepID=A0A951QBJ6_9CYAN|nr:antirestriction protein ArdA [Drouetiella hepatica Uher 2000/2452]
MGKRFDKKIGLYTVPSERTSIYIADLAEYNDGNLEGDWFEIDDSTTVEDVHAAIKEILERGVSDGSPHEEWAIHDYNNIPLDSEYPDIELVLKVASLVRKHSYEEVAAFLKHFDETQIDDFERRAMGIYSSEEEYLDEVNDFSSIPEKFLTYLDYKKMFRDYELSGEIIREDVFGGDFILFYNH